jgi:hypothetical protein
LSNLNEIIESRNELEIETVIESLCIIPKIFPYKNSPPSSPLNMKIASLPSLQPTAIDKPKHTHPSSAAWSRMVTEVPRCRPNHRLGRKSTGATHHQSPWSGEEGHRRWLEPLPACDRLALCKLSLELRFILTSSPIEIHVEASPHALHQ